MNIDEDLKTVLKSIFCVIALTVNVYMSKLFLTNFRAIYSQLSSKVIDRVSSSDRSSTSSMSGGCHRAHSAFDEKQGELILRMMTESDDIKAIKDRVEYSKAKGHTKRVRKRWSVTTSIRKLVTKEVKTKEIAKAGATGFVRGEREQSL